MLPAGLILRPFSAWHLFFAIIAVAWTILFALAFDMSASGSALELGPGMGWMNGLTLTFAGTFKAICLSFGDVNSLHTSLWLIFVMWLLMAVAMMGPTTVPLLKGVSRANGGQVSQNEFVHLLMGYFVAWATFAVFASVLQHGLSSWALLSEHGVSQSAPLSATLLLVAGLYQFTNTKRACLGKSQANSMAHQRGSQRRPFNAGLHYGVLCVGCCWALMLLTFIGGTMNLVWMGIAMMIMVIEKLPFGHHISSSLGLLLVAASGAIAAQAVVTP